MAGSAEQRIVEAERTASGILITFQNGETALYSPQLLWSMFQMAEKIPEDATEQAKLPGLDYTSVIRAMIWLC